MFSISVWHCRNSNLSRNNHGSRSEYFTTDTETYLEYSWCWELETSFSLASEVFIFIWVSGSTPDFLLTEAKNCVGNNNIIITTLSEMFDTIADIFLHYTMCQWWPLWFLPFCFIKGFERESHAARESWLLYAVTKVALERVWDEHWSINQHN